jgi:inhibitor of KinA sporulation pathway (predicted exonuclease)
VYIPCPFRYNQPRDTRTIYDLAGIDVGEYRSAGTHHNALDDAAAQARAVQAAVKALNLR